MSHEPSEHEDPEDVEADDEPAAEVNVWRSEDGWRMHILLPPAARASLAQTGRVELDASAVGDLELIVLDALERDTYDLTYMLVTADPDPW
jgi:hypothetical protein